MTISKGVKHGSPDLCAAGLERTEALSGYRYQGGLGNYQRIRDNGITTAQCMYAPEFSSHSEGVRVKVSEE
jgi:hypothetical protein